MPPHLLGIGVPVQALPYSTEERFLIFEVDQFPWKVASAGVGSGGSSLRAAGLEVVGLVVRLLRIPVSGAVLRRRFHLENSLGLTGF
jgi:hypothetical protein